MGDATKLPVVTDSVIKNMTKETDSTAKCPVIVVIYFWLLRNLGVTAVTTVRHGPSHNATMLFVLGNKYERLRFVFTVVFVFRITFVRTSGPVFYAIWTQNELDT